MSDYDPALMELIQERGENGEFFCPICGDTGVEQIPGGHGTVLEVMCSECGGLDDEG